MSDPAKMETPLNGQQMQAVQTQIQTFLQQLRTDVELRKLSLQRACDVYGEKPGDVVKLAEQMHAFLTQTAIHKIPNQG